jgi:hypothetical protein
MAKLSDGFVDGAMDAGFLADIKLNAYRAAAECFDFLRGGFERIERAAGDGDIRPSASQHACELLTKPAAGASDEGGLISEIEWI